MRILKLAALAIAPLCAVHAQANYEIQVYPSETADKNTTFFELHSNYTGSGSTTPCTFSVTNQCEYPTNHQLHETLEITHGWNDRSELGFYWFMSKPDGQGLQWVGTHLRPRVRVPESWGWPVGVSISQEIGWSKAEFSGEECFALVSPPDASSSAPADASSSSAQ